MSWAAKVTAFVGEGTTVHGSGFVAVSKPSRYATNSGAAPELR
jgi:hypothetical protein